MQNEIQQLPWSRCLPPWCHLLSPWGHLCSNIVRICVFLSFSRNAWTGNSGLGDLGTAWAPPTQLIHVGFLCICSKFSFRAPGVGESVTPKASGGSGHHQDWSGNTPTFTQWCKFFSLFLPLAQLQQNVGILQQGAV